MRYRVGMLALGVLFKLQKALAWVICAVMTWMAKK